MATAQDFINEGLRHVGATYNAQGGRTWMADVESPSSFDCSGFIAYIMRRLGAHDNYDLSWVQYKISQDAGLAIDVEQARQTAGALLFKEGTGANGHVAISLGNGDTLESTGSGGGVRVVKGGAMKDYYTVAALAPGITYDGNFSVQSNGVEIPEWRGEGNDPRQDPAYQLALINATILGDNVDQWAAIFSPDMAIEGIAGSANTSIVEGGDPTAALEQTNLGMTGDTAGTTSGTQPGTPGTSGDWMADVLKGIGAPDTPENRRALSAWERSEDHTGGAGQRFNWMNTTQDMDGAQSINSHGVKKYTSYEQGVQATVKTLTNGMYQPIIAAFQKGDNAMAVADAVAASPWGTGGLMQRVLGSKQ